MSEKRIEKWDNAKGILIILVVLGHVIEPGVNSKGYLNWLFLFIYMFHMPAFFFLSGMLSKSTVYSRKYDRIAGYLFLFFAMKMIVFLSKTIVAGKPAGFHLYSEAEIPWYAFCMTVYLLVVIPMQDLKKTGILIGSVLLACFAGYDDSIGDVLVLSRTICFFPFFYAGYCIQENALEKVLSTKKLRIGSGIILVLLLLMVWRYIDRVYWIRPLITGRNPFSKLTKFSGYGGILRLGYYGVAACIVGMMLAVSPCRKSFLGFLGRRSLAIYVFHKPLLNLLNWHQLRDRFINWSIFPTHLVPCLIVTVFVLALCSMKTPYRICRGIMNVKKRS